jgi:hypothetical protein
VWKHIAEKDYIAVARVYVDIATICCKTPEFVDTFGVCVNKVVFAERRLCGKSNSCATRHELTCRARNMSAASRIRVNVQVVKSMRGDNPGVRRGIFTDYVELDFAPRANDVKRARQAAPPSERKSSRMFYLIPFDPATLSVRQFRFRLTRSEVSQSSSTFASIAESAARLRVCCTA